MKYLFALLVALFLGAAFMLARFYNDIRFEVDKIVHYESPMTTQILDRKGRLVANLFEHEFRFYSPFEEIPPRIIEALAAVEDTLFFEHGGINLDAISRAMIKNIKSGRYTEGGSTITQQLIKNVALSREKSLERKLKEALLAIRLETVLSKEEILERYLNHTYFGHGYYGIKAAARGYFKKDMDRLSLKEIAILVGLPRAPSFYDPTKNLEFSLGRANNILQRMHSLGWITDEELDLSIGEVPIVYNETLTQNIAPYVVDEVLKELRYIEDLKSGGYTIRLNIDLDYQEIAKEALTFGYEQIKARRKKDDPDTLNGAIVVLENRTGKILAMIGGVDYRKSTFNRATQSKRQPGSSFKPFIYQTALDLGYATNSPLADIARTYEYTANDEAKVWQPKNYGNTFSGIVPLKEALVKSLNLATINLVEEVGFERIYRKSLTYGFNNIPKNLSIALGSFGVSPLEMSRAYTLFSNYGTMMSPRLIESITDYRGKTLSFDLESKVITPPEQSFLMIDVMREAVNKGTGRRARVNGIEIAGKTGSTNENVDAWFCGFTPTIQAVIWYGRDDNTPIGHNETGGVAAAPAFSYFFEKLLKIEPGIKREFDVPRNVHRIIKDGELYYYTDTSKPKEEAPSMKEENLIF